MKRFPLILFLLVACSRTTEPQETEMSRARNVPPSRAIAETPARDSLLDPPLEYIGPHGLRVNATAPEGGPVLRDGDADRRPHWQVYEEGGYSDGPARQVMP